jgi:hypothetical protein
MFKRGHIPNKATRKGSPTHTIRAANGLLITLKLTRKLAMACFCTECLGWETNPSECTAPLCPLFPYRVKTLRTMRGTIDPKQLVK